MNTSPSDEATLKDQRIFLWGMMLSMFCWGLSWTSGKVISHYAEGGTIALYRFCVTFVSMIFVVWVLKINITVVRQGWIPLIICAVLISIYSYLFFQGLTLGKAGAAGVLVTILNPVISYAIMLLMQKRLPNKKESLGLALGLLAGVVLLKLWTNWEMVFDSGNSYFLLASLTWAILSIFTSKSSKYGSPVAFSFWMYGIGSLLLFLLFDKSNILELWGRTDFVFWGNMIFSATITTAFATTFYFVATSKIGASKASSFIFLVPFSATLGSWIFLSEVPMWNTVVGGCLGVVAVYVLNKK